MSTEFAYRKLTVSTHGGILVPGISHITKANGIVLSAHYDLHICPLKKHGVTMVMSSGFAKTNGINLTRVGDMCGCGAMIGNATSRNIKTDGE